MFEVKELEVIESALENQVKALSSDIESLDSQKKNPSRSLVIDNLKRKRDEVYPVLFRVRALNQTEVAK